MVTNFNIPLIMLQDVYKGTYLAPAYMCAERSVCNRHWQLQHLILQVGTGWSEAGIKDPTADLEFLQNRRMRVQVAMGG